MSFKSFYDNTGLANDPNPNATPPTTSFVNTGFDVHPVADGLIAVVDGAAGDSVTATLWLADETDNRWVPIMTGLVVAFGTAQFVSIPPQAKCFLQVTGKTGAPVSLRAGWTY